MNDTYKMKNENVAKRKSHLFRNLLWVLGGLLVVCAIVFSICIFIKKYNSSKVTTKTLKRYWESQQEDRYELIYKDGKQLLQADPFNNSALVYFGYACFYLAVSQTDSSQMQFYLDECINSLRLARYDSKSKTLSQINYMLGKAYFYKNKISGNFYADLTVKFLNEAIESGYKANDIHEYLGMSYAALDMPVESIMAFSEALLVRESDNLLVSIAEQYKKNGQYAPSKQYLFRVVNNCDNDELVEKSRIMLGNIYLEEEDFNSAKNEFEEVLRLNEMSAEAHYGIGCIYEAQGNMVKARSEWRSALKLQPNHSGAQRKLGRN